MEKNSNSKENALLKISGTKIIIEKKSVKISLTRKIFYERIFTMKVFFTVVWFTSVINSFHNLQMHLLCFLSIFLFFFHIFLLKNI